MWTNAQAPYNSSMQCKAVTHSCHATTLQHTNQQQKTIAKASCIQPSPTPTFPNTEAATLALQPLDCSCNCDKMSQLSKTNCLKQSDLRIRGTLSRIDRLTNSQQCSLSAMANSSVTQAKTTRHLHPKNLVTPLSLCQCTSTMQEGIAWASGPQCTTAK
jgi:hypothetical protein